MSRLRRAILSILFATITARSYGAVPKDYDPSKRPGTGGAPTPVWVGIYFNDIFSITEKDKTFGADVYLLARWHDQRLENKSVHGGQVGYKEIWNPQLQVVNQRKILRSLPDSIFVSPDGEVEQRARLIGTFSTPMDFKEFPWDSQRLLVRFVAMGQSAREVKVLSDPRMRNAVGKPSLEGWTLGEVQAGPDIFRTPFGKSSAGFVASFNAQRSPRYYLFQFIIPLIFIVMMSWSVFWVSVEAFAQRQTVAVTAMLTIIAYRFAIAAQLPQIPYLTRFDYFLLGCTALVFLVLFEVIVVHRWLIQRKKHYADLLDLGWRIGFPIAFLVLTGIKLIAFKAF